MTAQFHDQLLLDEQVFSIVGVNGGELFDPSAFGLHPVPSLSACWRGYVCQYKVREGRLVLYQLEVNLGPLGEPASGLIGPAINGIQPVAPQGLPPFFDHRYASLNLAMPFSGGLLAGDGLLSKLYVHMGFHPAWKYETVFELIVFAGKVTEVRDVSERLAAIRATMTQRPLRPDPTDADADLRAWIDSTYKLNYAL